MDHNSPEEGDLCSAREHYLRGLAFHRDGRLNEAKDCYAAALLQEPDHAAARNLMGVVLHQLGQSDAGERELRRAIELQPESANYRNNLGALLYDQQKLGDAEQCFLSAIELSPQQVDAQINLSKILLERQEHERAIPHLRQALELDPLRAEGWLLLGKSHRFLGDVDSAISCFSRAYTLKPDLHAAAADLASAMISTGEFDHAAAIFRKIIERSNGDARLYRQYGVACENAGDHQTAYEAFSTAVQLDPSNVNLQIKRELVTPMVFQSESHLQDWRSRLSRLPMVVRSLAHSLTPNELGRSDCFPPYALVFQAENNSEWRRQYSNAFRSRFDDCAPVLESPRSKSLGIVVAPGDERAFCRMYEPLLKTLGSRLSFQIVCTSTSRAIMESVIAGCKELHLSWCLIPGHLPEAAEVIALKRFALLFFFKVGSSSFSYFLGHYRLAPFQFTSVGIQDTTGVSTIDEYLSSRLAETETAQQSYTERLALLDCLPFVPTRIALPKSMRRRSEFGLPEDRPVFLVNQKIVKFHPAFDQILEQVLASLPNSVIVITVGSWPFAAQQLLLRWQGKFGKAAERIVLQSRLATSEMLELTSLVDVVLDTYPASGGWTSFEALAVGTPLVTLKGDWYRGRLSSALLQLANVPELITESVDDYIRIVKLLTADPAFRNSIRKKLKSVSVSLFDPTGLIDQFTNYCEEKMSRVT